MSIVWSLKRLFDPAAHYLEEGEQQAEREQPRHTHSGDPPRFEVATRTPTQDPPLRFCCRVCGYESRSAAYCPECLADTMQPAPEAEQLAESPAGDRDENPAGDPARSPFRSP